MRAAAIGDSGLGVRVGPVVATLVLSAFVVPLGYRDGGSLMSVRARSRQHAQSARIVGRSSPVWTASSSMRGSNRCTPGRKPPW